MKVQELKNNLISILHNKDLSLQKSQEAIYEFTKKQFEFEDKQIHFELKTLNSLNTKKLFSKLTQELISYLHILELVTNSKDGEDFTATHRALLKPLRLKKSHAGLIDQEGNVHLVHDCLELTKVMSKNDYSRLRSGSIIECHSQFETFQEGNIYRVSSVFEDPFRESVRTVQIDRDYELRNYAFFKRHFYFVKR